MLINGVDLSVLGIQLYDRILQSNSVDTSQEWLEGDIQPTFIRQQDKFKNIQVSYNIDKFENYSNDVINAALVAEEDKKFSSKN